MAQQNEILISELIITIKNIIRYLVTKWGIILLFVILGGGIGVVSAWITKPKYVANISFFTESDSKSSLGAYAGIASQFGFDLGGAGGTVFEGDNLIEILHSKNLVGKTLLSPVDENSNTLMINSYLVNNEINKNWKTNKKYNAIVFEQYASKPNRIRDSVLDVISEGIIKKELSIQKRDKKLDLIDVTMTSGNEYFAKRFVEILTANAIKFYTDYKIRKSSQNVAILQKQTDSVRYILFGNISQVAEMNDVNINPLRQTVRTGVQRKQVDVQANSALYAELLKNLELSKLALRRETPLILVVDQPSLPLKREKPGRLLSGVIYGFSFGILVVIYLILRLWFIKTNIISSKKSALR